MRVITGIAKGRKLQKLEGREVRPTTDRIKEAIFSVLQFELSGRRFLDLFSGCGQMGIEALSRSASECFFVDHRKESIDMIQENLELTGLGENAKVFCMDAVSFLSQTDEMFDFVFLDPPYGTGLLQKVLPMLPEKMTDKGKILCESPQGESLPDTIDNFMLTKESRYGKIKISVYCHKDVVS